MVHHLKTRNPFFVLVQAGKKKAEVRKNDRNFRTGDILVLEEVTRRPAGMGTLGPESIFEIKKTGRKCTRWITDITDFPEGLRPGYVMLSLGKIPRGVRF